MLGQTTNRLILKTAKLSTKETIVIDKPSKVITTCADYITSKHLPEQYRFLSNSYD